MRFKTSQLVAVGEESGPVEYIVKRLHRKLGDDASNPACIFADPRVGYRLEKEETQQRNRPQFAGPPLFSYSAQEPDMIPGS